MAMPELIKNPRAERRALILGRVVVKALDMRRKIRLENHSNHGDVIIIIQDEKYQTCSITITQELLEMTTIEIAVMTIIDQLKLESNGI